MGDLESMLPDPPTFSDDEMKRCRETGNDKPLMVRRYKFVATLAAVVVHIRRDSPAFRPIPAQHYHVLMGLLNRCARLMLANLTICREGKFGETTSIIDRWICESTVKIVWLCHNASQEEFNRYRYLAGGLKTEIESRSYIQSQITARSRVAVRLRQWTSPIARCRPLADRGTTTGWTWFGIRPYAQISTWCALHDYSINSMWYS